MKPDTCGCCEPAAKPTPLKIDNRPGLSAIAYRVGTFSSFRQAMLQAIAGTPELASLRTRRSDDYAITLFELWATVADILSFYQERIANEGFLRTARLRDSVLRLVRLLDYQLGPGIAATAYLAFTTEKEKQVTIPVGLKIQSVPGQDEQPQKFETLERMTADARLNCLRIFPAPFGVNPLAQGNTEAILVPGPDGLAIVEALAPGDGLLVFHDGQNDPVEHLEIKEVRIEDDRIVLAWLDPIETSSWTLNSSVFKTARTFRLFGYNAPSTYMHASKDGNVAGGIKWKLEEEAPWTFAGGSSLALDALYEGISVGSRLLVFAEGGQKKRVTVTAVSQTSETVGPMSDTVTRLTVVPSLSAADLAKLQIYELTAPPIRFWGYTYPDEITTPTVYLPGKKIDSETVEIGRTIAGGAYQAGVKIGLKEIEVGRKVLLLDDQEAPVATVITGASLVPLANQDYLALHFDSKAAIHLASRSAMLQGNVALAGHGEIVEGEIVGDGDAATAFQRFSLKKKPVTFTPSAGPGGVKNTLKVSVNGVLWKEVPSLFGHTPMEQVYTTRIADDEGMTIQFGDGVTGDRPPSGRGNIVTTYRKGLGLAGRVRSSTLTTLLTRPVGLKSVINPAPAEGGADPETLDQARQNAPATVRTFGRAVSLRDFEDLVRLSGEVAKAGVTWVWNGEACAVHLTIAGQEGGVFSPDALARIHAGLTAQRDPNRILLLDNYERVPMVVTATLGVTDTYVAADVEAAARAALLEALSFKVLAFGQAVHLSDIYQVLQEVAGVAWVDIDLFHFKDQSPAHLASRGADEAPVQEHLRIYAARPNNPVPPSIVLPAEQAWIEAPTQDITLLSSGGLPA